LALDLTVPTIEEAVPDALVAWMVARLGSLTTMLARDGLTPVPAPVSGQIYRNDGLVIPAYKYWFAVRNGRPGSGIHLTPGLTMQGESDGHGYCNHVQLTISCYVNQKAQFSTNPATHENARELLLDRMSGWVRWVCFNNFTGLLIPLGSREYSVSPNTDTLKGGSVMEVKRGEVGKGPEADIWTPAVQMTYEGDIQ
jgi:hypothetical protein